MRTHACKAHWIGRHRWQVLLFGLTTSPEVFRRALVEILAGLEGVAAISDEILAWSSTLDEHDHRLRAVMKRLHEHSVRLDKVKCEFRREELNFYGHIFNQSGIRPAADKVEALKRCTAPTYKIEV